MMVARWVVLFEVSLLHDYFLSLGATPHEALPEEQGLVSRQAYSCDGFMEVLPDLQTRQCLAGHRMIFKPLPTGFLVAAQTDPKAPGNPPILKPKADFRLGFGLRITEPRFFNFTALPMTSPGFYRFNNESGNAIADALFLTSPVPPYSSTRHYEAGEIHAEYSGGDARVFHAVRDTGPAPAPIPADWRSLYSDTFDPNITYTAGSTVISDNRVYRARVNAPGGDLLDASKWLKAADLGHQHVSAGDRVPLAADSFDLDLAGRSLSRATVRLFRPGAAAAASEQTYATNVGELGRIRLDLRRLAPGLYRIQARDADGQAITGLDSEFYLHGQARRENWFGVIEIGLGRGEFALLDPAGGLRSPKYTLRFLNRATRWRYVFPRPQRVGTGADVTPENGDGRVLTTADPRPLTRFGTGLRLQTDDPGTLGTSEEVVLPEPETHRIHHRNAQWWSEIHLSNLPL